MSTGSDRPKRRFGPYPEDAAQDAIYARIEAERDPVGAALRQLDDWMAEPDPYLYWPKWEPVILTVVSALREARRESERYREALQEIAQGAGAFSRDPLTHAGNVIQRSIDLANEALVSARVPETEDRNRE